MVRFTQIDLVRLIPIWAAVAVVVAVVMAWRGPVGSPPDEPAHLKAGMHYFDHWVPPRIGDPDLFYDHFGRSRLSELGVDYWLAGKVALPLVMAGVPEVLALRLTSCFMFAALLAWLCRRRETRPMALPLLITSQVWYVFSYLNGDALPLALSFVLVQQLFWSGSSFRKSLGEPGLGRRLIRNLPIGAALGILFISKLNYLPFWLLATAAAIVISYVRSAPSRRLTSVAIPLLIMAAIVAGRYAVDFKINGLGRGEQIEAAREIYAIEELNPSTLRESPKLSHWGSGLRGKGVPFLDVITDAWWLYTSGSSFAGVYGGMNIMALPWVYAFVFAFYIGIAIAVLREGFFSGPGPGSAEAAVLFLFFLITVASSAFYSWNWDYQPQGRYLFPILPALGAFIALRPGVMRRPLMRLCSLGAWLWSLVIFVGVGLRNLAW